LSPVVLTSGGDVSTDQANGVAPDGTLYFQHFTQATFWDIVRMPPIAGGPITPVVGSAPNELMGSLSPDGRWIAYVRDGQHIVVQSTAGSGSPVVIANDGSSPAWSRDGSTILFERSGAIWAVPVTAGATFGAGAPVRRFTLPFPVSRLQFTRDGRAAVVVPGAVGSREPELIVLQR
jgi:hypothetical protein